MVVSWCLWSATLSATAMLVSTRRSAPLSLVGTAERLDEIVVDLRVGGGNHKACSALNEGLPRQRLDAQASAVGGHFNLPWAQPDVIAQLLRDHQTSCLINGCTHA